MADETTVEQTPAEIDAALQQSVTDKAAALSASLGCKVHPLIFKDPDTKENVIGYFKEPSRDLKLAVMDKAMVYPMSAVAEVLPVVLIKEESDKRIWEEKPENDKYFLGACSAVYNIVTLAINQFKKK